jgi:superfamily I DNA and/or RNA helicase
MAAGIYTQNFKTSTVVVDEASQMNLADLFIPIAHFSPTTLLLVGDKCQLPPVVTGPHPKNGFLPDLTMSAIKYFQDAHWPATVLNIQRRSTTKLMTIPFVKYYGEGPVNGPRALSSEAHPHTAKFCKVMAKHFVHPDEDNDATIPVYY